MNIIGLVIGSGFLLILALLGGMHYLRLHRRYLQLRQKQEFFRQPRDICDIPAGVYPIIEMYCRCRYGPAFGSGEIFPGLGLLCLQLDEDTVAYLSFGRDNVVGLVTSFPAGKVRLWHDDQGVPYIEQVS